MEWNYIWLNNREIWVLFLQEKIRKELRIENKSDRWPNIYALRAHTYQRLTLFTLERIKPKLGYWYIGMYLSWTRKYFYFLIYLKLAFQFPHSKWPRLIYKREQIIF